MDVYEAKARALVAPGYLEANEAGIQQALHQLVGDGQGSQMASVRAACDRALQF